MQPGGRSLSSQPCRGALMGRAGMNLVHRDTAVAQALMLLVFQPAQAQCTASSRCPVPCSLQPTANATYNNVTSTTAEAGTNNAQADVRITASDGEQQSRVSASAAGTSILARDKQCWRQGQQRWHGPAVCDASHTGWRRPQWSTLVKWQRQRAGGPGPGCDGGAPPVSHP